MIKLVYCVARKADMPQEEFFRYWKENHGPLVKSFAETLNAKRYVQSHRIDSPLNAIATQARSSAEGYDGVTEIWWESQEVLLGALQTEEGQAAHAALVADEATFCDFSKSSLFLTEEHTIFEA